jgi:hypothetical protein
MTELDRYLNSLLEIPSGLREDVDAFDPRIVASYRTPAGTRSFAFCRDGLLIEPDSSRRYIAFGDIADTGLHDTEVLAEFKEAVRTAVSVEEKLAIRLHDGELVEIPLNDRPDRMSERLTIAGLIARYVRIASGGKHT